MMILKGTEEYQQQIALYIKSLRLDEAKYTQKEKATQCGIQFSKNLSFPATYEEID